MIVYEEVNNMIEDLQDCISDSYKFDGGNDAAGTRVRKVLQEVRSKAQKTRLGIIKERKERKE